LLLNIFENLDKKDLKPLKDKKNWLETLKNLLYVFFPLF